MLRRRQHSRCIEFRGRRRRDRTVLRDALAPFWRRLVPAQSSVVIGNGVGEVEGRGGCTRETICMCPANPYLWLVSVPTRGSVSSVKCPPPHPLTSSGRGLASMPAEYVTLGFVCCRATMRQTQGAAITQGTLMQVKCSLQTALD